MRTLRTVASGLLGVMLAAAAWAPAALAGWPNDASVNVSLGSGDAGAYQARAVSDGHGGAIVVWTDFRNSVPDLYAQRVDASGTCLWGPTGVQLTTEATVDRDPVIVTDGLGGALVAYLSSDGGELRALRVSDDGTLPWGADGILITAKYYERQLPGIVSDGRGGAYVVWQDTRVPPVYVLISRVKANGTFAWYTKPDQNRIEHTRPQVVSDGAGGAVMVWQEVRDSISNDVYAQHFDSTSAATWTENGVLVAGGGGEQYWPSVCPDGAGGAIVGFMSGASFATARVQAQRLNSSGSLLWAAGGVPLCPASVFQFYPQVQADGSGGAIVAWNDGRTGQGSDVVAQRVDATGALKWPATGVPAAGTPGDQFLQALVPDGTGGAFVVLEDDAIPASRDIDVQHVTAGGVAGWAQPGVLAIGGPGSAYEATAIADGAGGVIVAARAEYRPGMVARIFAQRIDAWGHLGAQPAILQVSDHPGDEGGQVVLAWAPSPLDTAGGADVVDYALWRQVPKATAEALRARDAREARTLVREVVSAAGTTFWEYQAAVRAEGLAAYVAIVPTACDSSPAGNPLTAFMVEARSASGPRGWFSDPVAGYSVDNLPPAAPAPFIGQYVAGTSTLLWGASSAADFSTYRLYRGLSAAFALSPASLVVTKPGSGYADHAGQPFYYKVTAVDVHGNESAASMVLPTGALDVAGQGTPLAFALAPPTPNPVRESAVLRFTLPEPCRVTLALYDAQGRRVRTLLAGPRPAGEYGIAWDGMGDGGQALADALYFVRLDAGGRSLVRRLARVR
jgi:hypothetical protein